MMGLIFANILERTLEITLNLKLSISIGLN